MTLATIRTMISAFTGEFYANYTSAAPTAAELTDQVNWAIRTFSTYTWCNYDHKIGLTLVASTDRYDCRRVAATAVVTRKVLEPRFVTIDSKILYGPDGKPGLWSLKDLHRWHEGYQTYASGTPVRAIWLPGAKLLVSPPPDTAMAAQTDHYISGVYLAADLVNSSGDSDSPDIPEEAHECLAFLAAQKAIQPGITEAEGFNKVGVYRSEWREMADDMRSQNRQAILGPSPIRGFDSEWLRDGMFI